MRITKVLSLILIALIPKAGRGLFTGELEKLKRGTSGLIQFKIITSFTALTNSHLSNGGIKYGNR